MSTNQRPGSEVMRPWPSAKWSSVTGLHHIAVQDIGITKPWAQQCWISHRQAGKNLEKMAGEEMEELKRGRFCKRDNGMKLKDKAFGTSIKEQKYIFLA